tara:strand:+ start:389 stop:1243 length:855 start_codon:yes stop_codon:yes gene_type:complete
MANGIQDLTSIMTQGGREDIPQQAMMGGMPPDMGGGLGAMMPPQTPPMSPPDMGGMPPDMGGMSPDMMIAEQMPMQEEPMPMQEEQGSIEEDSVQLAGAVMERAGNDPETAVAILDGAAGLIMQSVQQEPMMAASGKYMKPKYAAEGEYLGEESDTLRQMIMDRIQNSPITSMTDVTRGQGMILNEGDLMGMNSQKGRTLSDADLERFLNTMGEEFYNVVVPDRDLEKLINKRNSMTIPDERLERFLEAYEANPDAFSKDAEYYNMLEDERKKAAERAKLYRSR